MGGAVEVGVVGYRTTDKGSKRKNSEPKEARSNGTVPRNRILSNESAESAIDVAECLSSDNYTENGDSGHWTENSTDVKVSSKEQKYRSKEKDRNSNQVIEDSKNKDLMENTHTNVGEFNGFQAQGSIYEGVCGPCVKHLETSDGKTVDTEGQTYSHNTNSQTEFEITKTEVLNLPVSSAEIQDAQSHKSSKLNHKHNRTNSVNSVEVPSVDTHEVDESSNKNTDENSSCISTGASHNSAESKSEKSLINTATANTNSMIEKYFSSAKEKMQIAQDDSHINDQDNIVEIVHKKRKKKGRVKRKRSNSKTEGKIQTLDNISVASDAFTEGSVGSGNGSLDTQSSYPSDLQEQEVLPENHVNKDEVATFSTEQSENEKVADQMPDEQTLFRNPSQLSTDIAKLNEETLDLLESTGNKETDIYSGYMAEGPGARPKVFTERSPSDDLNPFSSSAGSPQGVGELATSPPGNSVTLYKNSFLFDSSQR